MAKRSSRKPNPPLRAMVVQASSQANERLRRAFDIVLEAAQRAEAHPETGRVDDEGRATTVDDD
jgi:hypothetical protein